jgi:hypothetical protein
MVQALKYRAHLTQLEALMTIPSVGSADTRTDAAAPRRTACGRLARRPGSIGPVAIVVIVAALVGAMVFIGPLGGFYATVPASHDAASAGPDSFFDARTAAVAAAQTYGNGSWTPVMAMGIVPTTSYFFNGPGSEPVPVTGGGGVANNTTVPGGNVTPPIIVDPVPVCGWQAVGSANLSGFTVPAAPNDVGTGLAPGWLFLFVQSTTGSAPALLVVTVLDGSASPYVTMGGGQCAGMYSFPEFDSIATGIIDSTAASQVANAWGGSAFLANVTGANETMMLTGPQVFHAYGCDGCGGVVPVSGGGNYSGNGTPITGPPPPPMTEYNITIPATWTIALGNGAPDGSMSSTIGMFFAHIDASNGTMLSLGAYLGPGGCEGYYSDAPCVGPIDPPTTTPLARA